MTVAVFIHSTTPNSVYTHRLQVEEEGDRFDLRPTHPTPTPTPQFDLQWRALPQKVNRII